MLNLSEDRRGLSEVVSTLILLVVAVLLAAVVTYYATNITMVRTETEAVQVSKPHIWVNSTGSVAAMKLQNLGGKDILVDKIVIRGVDCDWVDVKYYLVPIGVDVTGDFNLTYSGTEFRVDIGGVPAVLDWDTGTDDIPMRSGGTMLFFISDPANVTLDDIGTSISLTIFTSNAQWIIETNVISLKVA